MSDSAGPLRWSGPEYARHSSHHRSYDDWFLQRHPPVRSDTVVDLGCGTGEFTARLAAMVPDGRVLGVDQDASMLASARRHSAPNLEFIQAAAERVDEVLPPASADLVVSRAMLHWLPAEKHPQVFAAASTVLRSGGWLHLESGGAGNITRLIRLLDGVAARNRVPRPPDFPDAGTVFEQVEAAGFEIPAEGVRTVAQRRAFTREDLIGVLRTQATLVITRHLAPDAAAAAVEEVVAAVDDLRHPDGTFDQVYVRLEVLARRPA